MNKTFTFMAGALMLLTVSHARADSWLVVNSQATPQSFSLDNIRTLTFADDKLVVNTYDAAAAASFNLADLTTLIFSDNDPNAIAPVAIEARSAPLCQRQPLHGRGWQRQRRPLHRQRQLSDETQQLGRYCRCHLVTPQRCLYFQSRPTSN